MTGIRDVLWSIAAAERRFQKWIIAKGQDRQVTRGITDACFICGLGPWSWSYPVKREAAAPLGGEYLFPAWLPSCDACHADIEAGRTEALTAKLHEANPERRYKGMRTILPAFLAAREGPPVPRTDR
jgi:hypothetical protein